MESLLSKQVLVLNRFWQAVNICSVRRALSLLFEGHAEAVLGAGGEFHTDDFHEWRDRFSQGPLADHECIHTVSFKIRVPKVILLLFFDRLPKKEVKFTRHNIFDRDKNTSQYCGKIFVRRDHIG